MKKCLQCQGYLAQAAVVCPFCGAPVGGKQVAPVVRPVENLARSEVPRAGKNIEHDEAIGFDRSPVVMGIIITLLASLVIAALIWFWN